MQEENIVTRLEYRPADRTKSWVTLDQIDQEFPEVINMLSEIIFYPMFNAKAQSYARSIIDYIVLHSFISWKQFDSIIKIYNFPWESYRRSRERNVWNADVELRQIRFMIPGPDADQMQDDDLMGRYLPSGDERLEDYVHVPKMIFSTDL